jgi:hypothetical protein
MLFVIEVAQPAEAQAVAAANGGDAGMTLH